MAYLVVLLLALSGLVFCSSESSSSSEEDIDFKSCSIEDLQCSQRELTKFLQKSAGGDAKYGLLPFDPMTISMVCTEATDTVKIHFTNVRLTGLKNMQYTLLKIDKTLKTTKYNFTFDYNIESDMEVEYTEISKSISGTFKAKGKALTSTSSNYEIIPNDKGVGYLVMGPETTTCELLDKPDVDYSEEFSNITDPEIKEKDDKLDALSDEEKEQLDKKFVSRIIESAMSVVTNNFRAIDKVVPAKDFFSDIE